MFIKPSGGSQNVFLKCLNPSKNFIHIERNVNDFVSSLWFEGQAFADSQTISGTYSPDSVHVNNALSLSMMSRALRSTSTGLLLFCLWEWSIPMAEKTRLVFLRVKCSWLTVSFMESGKHFMSLKNTNPILDSVCGPKLLTKETFS